MNGMQGKFDVGRTYLSVYRFKAIPLKVIEKDEDERIITLSVVDENGMEIDKRFNAFYSHETNPFDDFEYALGLELDGLGAVWDLYSFNEVEE